MSKAFTSDSDEAEYSLQLRLSRGQRKLVQYHPSGAWGYLLPSEHNNFSGKMPYYNNNGSMITEK